jgi:hypothetical protein
MCQFHYSLTNESSTVTNKSITLSTTTDFTTESGTVTTNSLTVTTGSSTVMEIDIIIQQVMELLEWEIENKYTLLLLCANFGDIHLYLICPILGKFQWMVERNVD